MKYERLPAKIDFSAKMAHEDINRMRHEAFLWLNHKIAYWNKSDAQKRRFERMRGLTK